MNENLQPWMVDLLGQLMTGRIAASEQQAGKVTAVLMSPAGPVRIDPEPQVLYSTNADQDGSAPAPYSLDALQRMSNARWTLRSMPAYTWLGDPTPEPTPEPPKGRFENLDW